MLGDFQDHRHPPAEPVRVSQFQRVLSSYAVYPERWRVPLERLRWKGTALHMYLQGPVQKVSSLRPPHRRGRCWRLLTQDSGDFANGWRHRHTPYCRLGAVDCQLKHERPAVTGSPHRVCMPESSWLNKGCPLPFSSVAHCAGPILWRLGVRFRSAECWERDTSTQESMQRHHRV